MLQTAYIEVMREGAHVELTITGEIDCIPGVSYRGCDPAPGVTVQRVMLGERSWDWRLTDTEEREAGHRLLESWRNDGAFAR